MKPPRRLIDLHIDWLSQYHSETTIFDGPAANADATQRLAQVEGYLQGTWIAVLSCHRSAEDWARQPDPRRALGDLIARLEAEFCGRLLYGPDDLARCLDDRDGLCWGLIGVDGLDALVREADDLERIPAFFERGVRLFQPSDGASGVLAGTTAPGDDRGLTELGRRFLETLAALGDSPTGPRPILDLSRLNSTAMGETIAWFEASSDRPERVIPIYSHGALERPGFDSPRALTLENLARLRTLGGVVGLSVGLPFVDSPDSLKAALESAAAIPYQGAPGFAGLAIGTDYLQLEQTLPGLGNAAEVATWIERTFDAPTAEALIQGNALGLCARTVGLPPSLARSEGP